MPTLNTVEDESGYVIGNYVPTQPQQTKITVVIESANRYITIGERFAGRLTADEVAESLSDELTAAWPLLEPKEQPSPPRMKPEDVIVPGTGMTFLTRETHEALFGNENKLR